MITESNEPPIDTGPQEASPPPTGGYLIIDTETTGLPPKWRKGDPIIPADDPRQPRVCEVSLIYLDGDLNVEKEFQAYIKPDGWTVSPGASEVNGLTTEFLDEHGVPILNVLHVYTAAILEGRVLVAHNAQFDTKMMRGELRRAGLDDLFEQTWNICTKDSLKGVCGNPHLGPKLSDACAHFGIPLVDPHRARNDTLGALGLLRAIKAAGIMPPPRILRAKNHPSEAGTQ